MEETEGRDQTAYPRRIQQYDQVERKPGDDISPGPRPRQDDQQQADIDEVTRVENNAEEPEDLHPIILAGRACVTFFR